MTEVSNKDKKSKKPNGEGTLYEYKSGYRGQIYINGKRKSFTGKTKTEVREKMKDAIALERLGLYIDSNSITVEELVRKSLKRRTELYSNGMSEQSYEHTLRMFENHVFPRIGKMRVQDLKKEHLEKMYAEAFTEKLGKDYSQKEYAHSTVNSLSTQFKKILQEAVDDEVIKKNPHRGVELHKLREPKKVSAFTREEQKKLVVYLKESNKAYDSVFYLCLCTGMRFGEAAALTWDDVDLKNRTITISKTSIEMHGSPIIQDHTKTEYGMRTIAITSSLASWLKELKKRQYQDLNVRNLVVPNSRYGIITSANSSKRFEKICAIVGIEYKGKHSLRHTWATRALEEGMDVKTVSQMLGHKNVITTMNIYQDALKEHQEEQIKKLEELF